MPYFIPHGFTVGIEFLNDPTTPMEFVVTAMMRHLQMSRTEAIRLMLNIHTKGGYLVPTSNLNKAMLIASAFTADAQEFNHKFICRAVEISKPDKTVP